MPRWRPPTKWYLLNLVISMIGMPALVIGFGAEIRIRLGVDVFSAIDREGFAALLFSGFVLYAFRIIFWNHVPERWQNLTRNLVILTLCAELMLAAVAVLLVATQGNISAPSGGTFIAIWFTGCGVLCQISTALWLLRYRRE